MPMLNTPTSGITRPPVAISGYQAPTATYSSSAHGVVTSRGEFYPVRMGGDVKWRPEGYEDVGVSRLMTTNVKLPQPLNFSSFSEYFWDRKVPDKNEYTAEKTGNIITKITANPQEYASLYRSNKGVVSTEKYSPYEALFSPKGDIMSETIRGTYQSLSIDKPIGETNVYAPYDIQTKIYGGNVLKSISEFTPTQTKNIITKENVGRIAWSPKLTSYADYEKKMITNYTPEGARYINAFRPSISTPKIYGLGTYDTKTNTYTTPTGQQQSMAQRDIPQYTWIVGQGLAKGDWKYPQVSVPNIYGLGTYNKNTSTYTTPTGQQQSMENKNVSNDTWAYSRKIIKPFKQLSIKNIFKGGKRKWL